MEGSPHLLYLSLPHLLALQGCRGSPIDCSASCQKESLRTRAIGQFTRGDNGYAATSVAIPPSPGTVSVIQKYGEGTSWCIINRHMT